MIIDSSVIDCILTMLCMVATFKLTPQPAGNESYIICAIRSILCSTTLICIFQTSCSFSISTFCFSKKRMNESAGTKHALKQYAELTYQYMKNQGFSEESQNLMRPWRRLDFACHMATTACSIIMIVLLIWQSEIEGYSVCIMVSSFLVMLWNVCLICLFSDIISPLSTQKRREKIMEKWRIDISSSYPALAVETAYFVVIFILNALHSSKGVTAAPIQSAPVLWLTAAITFEALSTLWIAKSINKCILSTGDNILAINGLLKECPKCASAGLTTKGKTCKKCHGLGFKLIKPAKSAKKEDSQKPKEKPKSKRTISPNDDNIPEKVVKTDQTSPDETTAPSLQLWPSCKTCGGTGMKDGKYCTTCKGKGYHIVT